MSIISAFSNLVFKNKYGVPTRGSQLAWHAQCGPSYNFFAQCWKKTCHSTWSLCLSHGWRSLLTPTSCPHPATSSAYFLWKLFYYLVETGIQISLIIWKWGTDPCMAASYLLCCISFSFLFLFMVLLYMWIHLQFRFVLFHTFLHFVIICNPYLLDWAQKS